MIRQIVSILMMCVSFGAISGDLNTEKQSVIAKDLRNHNVDFNLYESGKNLRYCINGLAAEGSAMDVFRILLQTADLLKEREFKQVELCFRMKTRFLLAGSDFKVIGNEYGKQNPIYTMRSFPEKLFLATGMKAYQEHQGGVLYLMRIQMEDFQDMNGKWFMNDLVAEVEKGKDAQRPKEFAKDEEVF